MKKLLTKGSYAAGLILLFLAAALPAVAQFTATNLTSGGLYTALAKDAAGNLYETQVQNGTSGAIYEVLEYQVSGGDPLVIYTGLTHETGDYPWGLAVDGSGNIYVSTDFTSLGGAILKLTNSGGTYSATTIQTGRYFSALAFDGSNNLYTAEYDATNNTYAVVKYASPYTGTGTKIYDHLKTAPGYTYPTGLAIAPNGDVFVADAFSNDVSITDGSRILKLTAASNYAASSVSLGRYATALAVDASGNLFSSENSGNGYRLMKYTGGGGTATVVYSPLHNNGIYYPWGIAVINADKIFVADGPTNTTEPIGDAILELLSANSSLANLTVTNATISPAFTSTVKAYSATVANTITSTLVTPTVSDPMATVTVSGNAVASGSGYTVPLNVGLNTIPVVVTAADGVTTTTYTIKITRQSSSDANLTLLTVNAGNLTPAFATGTTSYTVLVNNSHSTISFTPTVEDNTAKVKVNGVTVASGAASGAIPLVAGPNTINTVVTAQDGVTQITYSVVVTRQPSSVATLSLLVLSSATLNPAFATATTSYTASVPNATTSIMVRPMVTDQTSTVTVNGVATATSTYSAPITLNVGNNVIPVVVTAQDGTTMVTYTVTVNRSANADLAGLTLNPGLLTPTFGANKTSYTSAVSNAHPTTTVTPTLSDPAATVTVNGVAVTSGTASQPIALAEGTTTNINTVVTASDGITQKTYLVVMSRAASSVSTLSNIALSAGALSPTFSAAQTSYDISEPNSLTSVNVTPTATDANATIMVNGNTIPSGTPANIPLSVGENGVTIIVTSQDGSTNNTYTLSINRALSPDATLSKLRLSAGTLSPVFAPGTTGYSATVPFNTTSVTEYLMTNEPNATATVNGLPLNADTASSPMSLNVGANVITTVVTAQDGSTMQTYTITVNRTGASVASLYNLAVSAGNLTPVFATNTTSYTVLVSNGHTTISVTPTLLDINASVTVNGAAVASGQPSGNINLNVGPNVISTVVTAQDGVTTKTYTVTVTRQPSTNANLSALTLSSGTLSPAFAAATTSYTASVTNATASITVRPTASDPNATIKVNGTTVASGTSSAAISLAVGSNVISTVITASDGTTKKTYTVTVTRATPANALLSALTIAAGNLTPVFSSNTTSYTDLVSNNHPTITITPTAADATSTITVNGTAVASGTSSGTLSLAVGANVITTIVTASDGTTTKTYTITVTRQPPAGGALRLAYIPQPSNDVTVHKAVSPGADGINDFLRIDNIELYPENKISIVNNDGALVYTAKGYDNRSKTFDGHSNTGAMQKPGTYFYLLQYKDGGETKQQTGYIILKY